MEGRITDDVAYEVRLAIDRLPVLSTIKKRVKWEVFPLLGVNPAERAAARHVSVFYMVGVGLEVPQTGDHFINYDSLADPYDHAEIAALVSRLYQAAQDDADALALKVPPVPGNGRRPLTG